MASPPCCARNGSRRFMASQRRLRSTCRVVARYQSHGIGKGYTGGFHEYFGPDADIDSQILRSRKIEILRGAPFNIGLWPWSPGMRSYLPDVGQRFDSPRGAICSDCWRGWVASREWLAGGVKVGVFNKFLFNCPQNFRKTEQVWKLVGLSITIITCRYFWSSNMLFKPPTVGSPPVSPKLFFLVSGCEWHAHLVFASGLGWLWSGSLGGVLGQGPRPQGLKSGNLGWHNFTHQKLVDFFAKQYQGFDYRLAMAIPDMFIKYLGVEKPLEEAVLANLMNMRVTLHETNRHRPWK